MNSQTNLDDPTLSTAMVFPKRPVVAISDSSLQPSSTREPITHYVSLDLGSDSMAAYFEPLVPSDVQMVELQKYYAYFHGTNDGAEVVLGGAEHPSSLMRTLIFLREPLPPRYMNANHLQDDHARLEFIDADGKALSPTGPKFPEGSMFGFFPSPFAGAKIMPNPKLVYQSGCRKAIPQLLLREGVFVEFDPGTLLKHLTTQVLNNFVLHSPQLKNVSKKNIHVALTVPNVYSMTHARELQNFAQDILGMGRVSIVSESDALVYYLLSQTASSAVRNFTNTIVQPEKRDELRIVTLDIGRGTTDLSLVQIRNDKNSGTKRHFTAARTGVCSGGQGLSYILAKYYNDRLLQSFKDINKDNKDLKMQTPLFDFIHFTRDYKQPQNMANRALEKLIEKVKQTLDEEYRLDLPEQADLINGVFEIIKKEARRESNPTAEDDERLKEAMLRHFSLPRDWRNPSGQLSGGWTKLVQFIKGKPSPDPNFPHIAALIEDIEKYVKRNVNEMLEQLEEKARQFQEVQLGEPMRNVFEEDVTFVLVGGQASQFKPIQKAIREAIPGKIPSDHIFCLQHEEAKTACAKGAVAFLRTRPALLNENAFFGTYGFLAATKPVSGPSFVPVNSVEFMRTGRDLVKGVGKEDQYFIYVVRPVIPNDDYQPSLLDGYTSMIHALGDRNQQDITVEYDPARLYIKINGEDVVAVSGHGYVNEDIQPKLWPVIVDTQQEEKANIASPGR